MATRLEVLSAFVALLTLSAPAPAAAVAATPAKDAAKKTPHSRPHPPLAPLPVGEKSAWSHAPYEAGD